MISKADRLFRQCDPETWVITSRSGALQSGLIATYVTRASIVNDRPRLMVGLAKHHWTQDLIAESRSFAAHLITEQHVDWVWRFGTQSGRDFDKLSGLKISSTESAAPILDDAAGWLACRVEDVMDAGDRIWYLAEIVDASCDEDFAPLTVSRVLELADEEMRAKLDRQLRDDGLTDLTAIDHWRRDRE